MDVCNGEPHHFQHVSSDRLELPRFNLNKRKSSPAILDLPFHENQMSLYLSRQRNSIEAAMLLVNFNQSITLPKENKGTKKKEAYFYAHKKFFIQNFFFFVIFRLAR